MTVQQFLMAIIANYGSFGIVSWLSSAIIIRWQQRIHGELSNDDKRRIAIGTAIGIVVLAYFVGVLAGFWPFDGQTLLNALQPIIAELAGSKVIFALTKSTQPDQPPAQPAQ